MVLTQKKHRFKCHQISPILKKNAVLGTPYFVNRKLLNSTIVVQLIGSTI